MATYKTTNPKALAALQQRADDVAALREKAKAFAERFGASENFISQDTVGTGFRVAGFIFNPPKDTTLWRKPDREILGAQSPRTSLRAGTKQQRQMLAELNAEWVAHWPAGSVSWEPVLRELGTDSATAWLGGFQLFEHDGAIYARTGCGLTLCEEILNSEFDAARQAYETTKQRK